MGLYSVSPDGSSVLTNHKPEFTAQQPFANLFLATRQGVMQLGPDGPDVEGEFSGDGRAIRFSVSEPFASGDLRLARADGSGARVLSQHPAGSWFAGGWFYFADTADGMVTFLRLAVPDGAPEVLGSWSIGTRIESSTSPGGDSIAWCVYANGTSECHLNRSDGIHVDLQGPKYVPAWSPDGTHLMTSDCQLFDLSGRRTTFTGCGPWAFSADGSLLAIFAADILVLNVRSGELKTLARPSPIDASVFRPRWEVGFSPDGSRLVIVAGHASFSTPVMGGPWTQVSPDHGAVSPSTSDWPAISPDGRVVADTLDGKTVMSVDGASPGGVRAPDGVAMAGLPVFEPAGGLNKAIFASGVGGNLWLASADATRDWVRIAPDGRYCQWIGRTALCRTSSDEMIAVTDDGKQVVTLAATSPRSWAVAGGHVFYFAPGGGLFSIDRLPEPSP